MQITELDELRDQKRITDGAASIHASRGRSQDSNAPVGGIGALSFVQ